jgi:asparagine synthase (glutamine-hydrolysing)
MKDSVREHLLADVPLGVWLSGGVDSSAILHYASHASAAPIKTFSISFNGKSFDETKYIREVARHYGTDHEEMNLSPESNLREAIEQFAYFSDEPMADAGALPVWFLSRLSKKSATVVLSGEGADELFGGYLTYQASRLAEGFRNVPAVVRRTALAAARRWPVSDEKIGFEYKMQRFLEGSLLHPLRAHTFWNGTFSETQKHCLVRPQLPSSLDTILEEFSNLSFPKVSLEAFLRLDQKYYLADDILTKTDRMSMAHSLEVRPPFLDHRIVEFAASLPGSLKIRGTQQKFVLKQLMKNKLPPSIVRRKKVGFDIPVHEWLRKPLRDMMVEVIQDGTYQHPDLFRADVASEFVSLHLNRKANLGYHLWGLMILFLWMDKWQIQTNMYTSRETVCEEIGPYI